MKEALSEIIQLATVDTEPWVLMVADILKSFPETGSLNLDLEEQNPNVQDILGELREKGLSEINDCDIRRGSNAVFLCFFFSLKYVSSGCWCFHIIKKQNYTKDLFLSRSRYISSLDNFGYILWNREGCTFWLVWQLVVYRPMCVRQKTLLGALFVTPCVSCFKDSLSS